MPGARRWRRHLSEQAQRHPDPVALVDEALQYVLPRGEDVQPVRDIGSAADTTALQSAESPMVTARADGASAA